MATEVPQHMDELTVAREELARLHEGEEPVPPNRIPHRPGQWITLWNAQTPAERLAHAQRILDCSLACSQLQEKADYYRRQLKAAEDELAQWRQRAAARSVETHPLADDGPSAADLAGTAGYAPKDSNGNCPGWCPCHKMEATP